MKNNLTQEKVYRVLDLIAGSHQLSQRQLASHTGFSLGLINLILKRLLETGHIKVANLNRRKMDYLLTPKGMKEKANRTHSYISQTIKVFSEYQTRVEQLVEELMREKHASFAILGEGEIAFLMEMCLKNAAPGIPYRFVREKELPIYNDTVLDCRLKQEKGTVGISILKRLLQERSEIKEEKIVPMAVGAEN